MTIVLQGVTQQKFLVGFGTLLYKYVMIRNKFLKISISSPDGESVTLSDIFDPVESEITRT